MKHFFTFALLFLSASVCSVATAQSYEIKEGSIYIAEKQRNGLICYVDAPAKILIDAWRTHTSQKLGINTEKKKGDDNLYIAKKVVVTGITALPADFYTQIDDLNGKSVLTLAVGNGYDAYLNSTENKMEFGKLQRFTHDFLAQFCIQYYTKLLQTREAEYLLATNELTNLDGIRTAGGSQQRNAEAFKIAKVRFDQLGATTQHNRSEISKKQKDILALQNKIKDIYKDLPTFENREEFRFKQDYIKFPDNNAYNGYTGYVNASPANVASAWQSYTKSNLQLVSKEKKKNNYYEAKDADLPGICTKKADLKTVLEPYGNGTKISVSVAVGKDIALNSRDYPYEYNNLKRFLREFADLYKGNAVANIPADRRTDYDEYVENIIKNEKEIKQIQAQIAQNAQDSIEIVLILDELQGDGTMKNRNGTMDLEPKKEKIQLLKTEIAQLRTTIAQNTYQTNNLQVATATQTTAFAGSAAHSYAKRNELEATITQATTIEIPAEISAAASIKISKQNAMIVAQKKIVASSVPAIAHAAATKTDFYSVQKGDTLYSIATKLNTTVANLKAINKLNDEIIYPGFRLKISN